MLRVQARTAQLGTVSAAFSPMRSFRSSIAGQVREVLLTVGLGDDGNSF
jgi:hypothetical protein